MFGTASDRAIFCIIGLGLNSNKAINGLVGRRIRVDFGNVLSSLMVGREKQRGK
jgi:hypothetical protein